MYIADMLRLFAGGVVDGLLLDEGPAPVGELIDPEAYCPVLNIAGHYEWPVLICSGTVPAWPHGPVTRGRVDRIIGSPPGRQRQWHPRGRGFLGRRRASQRCGPVARSRPSARRSGAVMQHVRAVT
jgi:hypothetical protein